VMDELRSRMSADLKKYDSALPAMIE